MITCGACKHQHNDPAEVKACYEAKYNGFKPEAEVVIDHLAQIEAIGRFTSPETGVIDLAALLASVDNHPCNQPVEKRLPDGYFTVTFGEDDRVTLRVRTQKEDDSFAPGKQIVAYLSGPDNTADYRGFAFADAQTGRVNFWKRFKRSNAPKCQRYALNLVETCGRNASSSFGMTSRRVRVGARASQRSLASRRTRRLSQRISVHLAGRLL